MLAIKHSTTWLNFARVQSIGEFQFYHRPLFLLRHINTTLDVITQLRSFPGRVFRTTFGYGKGHVWRCVTSKPALFSAALLTIPSRRLAPFLSRWSTLSSHTVSSTRVRSTAASILSINVRFHFFLLLLFLPPPLLLLLLLLLLPPLPVALFCLNDYCLRSICSLSTF